MGGARAAGGEALPRPAKGRGLPEPVRRGGRAALACAGALALGALAVAGIAAAALQAAPGSAGPGAVPPEVRSGAVFALARAVYLQSLAPQIVVTTALWGLLAARWPRLEASWSRIALGGALAGGALAPLVTTALFEVWTPLTPLDSLRTWALLAAGGAACLALARRTIPGLGPGALAGRVGG